MSNIEVPERREIDIKRLTITSALIVVILWIFYWIAVMCGFTGFTERGQFGDMFGAINALFTGLAFAGVIVTIILQSHELSLQRDELKLTRAEFKQQNRTLKYQRFENTFFNLVEQYSRLKKEAFYIKMTEAFQKQMFKVNNGFSKIKYDYNEKNLLAKDGATIVSLCNEMRDEFGAHFNTFFRIVEYVYLKKKGTEIRRRYLRFFFAQLSNYELIAFFYHFHLNADDETPPEFEDYRKELFNSLHTSPLMRSGHYLTIIDRKD